jgi:plasmid maintenance system antidote protein VapI
MVNRNNRRPRKVQADLAQSPHVTICDQLRQAILESGKTHYRIGKDAGVKPEIVTRFVRRQRDIRAETFAKIALVLGMELLPKKGV